jgi:hypothetical protein
MNEPIVLKIHHSIATVCKKRKKAVRHENLFEKTSANTHICCAKSHRTGTVKNFTLRSESFKHSRSDLSGASSVTSMSESVESTTP